MAYPLDLAEASTCLQPIKDQSFGEIFFVIFLKTMLTSTESITNQRNYF